jgi:hypothetical protein
MSTGEVAIRARLHRSGRWITLPLSVGTYLIYPVLDTGSPVSALSPSIRTELLSRNLLSPTDTPRRDQLTGLTADGQALPDLEVGVLARLDRLGVDALLGLDFLLHFERIHFHVRTFQLVLEGA